METVERKPSQHSSTSFVSGKEEEEKEGTKDLEAADIKRAEARARDDVEIEEDRAARAAFWAKWRPLFLAALAAVILGWWISSTVLKATRHRWYAQTLPNCGRFLFALLFETDKLIANFKDRSDRLGMVLHSVSWKLLGHAT